MNSWKQVSDFINFTTKGITPKYVEKSSIIVLNQKCIRNNRIDYSFSQFTDDTKLVAKSKFVERGDILMNSTGTGTAGRCAFVSELPKNHRLITDSHILILRCSNYYEAQCLNYLLFSFEKELMSFMTGSSGQSELDKVVLMNLKTKMPTDSTTQKTIASLLSKLESKIVLNNRINAELEAMAKMLYDYWFVQFDFPNAEGKPYKNSGGKMVWCEKLKKDIPEGWKEGTLSDFGNIIGGSTPPREISEYFTNSGTAWITPKDLSLNSGNKFISKGELDVSDKGLKVASLNIMPKGTILLSSRAPIGYLAISRENVTTNQGFKSLVPNKGYSKEYVYYSVKNLIPAIENNAVGSTFKEVSASTLKSISICLADKTIVNKYTETVSTIFNRQDLLEQENQQLSSLRDWLLPMLMNGQVKVGDTTAVLSTRVEEVGGLMAAEPRERYGE